MTETLRLGLPLVAAGQSQKHVTVNEGLAMLDDLVQLAVLDDDRTTPPASPAAGDRHIVAALPTGAWAGAAGKIAAWQDGAWRFYTPIAGWVAYVAASNRLLACDGIGWRQVSAALPDTVDAIGIGGAADPDNPLTVRADNVLFAARPISAGGGDMRLKVNREGSGDTASHLFQSGWAGRAEFGLIGDDDFLLKVSPDGAAWLEALRVDTGSGAVRFPGQDSAIPFSHGACRLISDGALLRLSPCDGGGLFVGGAMRAVPAGGVTLAPAGLAAGVTFFVYAGWVSGAMVLEASETVPVAEPATGTMLKGSDASRTLVGMARTVAGPAWSDTPERRFVRSWFKRRRLKLSAALSLDAAIAAGALGAIDSALSLSGLAWADEMVSVAAGGSCLAGAATDARFAITVNATVEAQQVASLAAGSLWSPALTTQVAAGAHGLLTIACAAGAASAGLTWAGADDAARAQLRISAIVGA